MNQNIACSFNLILFTCDHVMSSSNNCLTGNQLLIPALQNVSTLTYICDVTFYKASEYIFVPNDLVWIFNVSVEYDCVLLRENTSVML